MTRNGAFIFVVEIHRARVRMLHFGIPLIVWDVFALKARPSHGVEPTECLSAVLEGSQFIQGDLLTG